VTSSWCFSQTITLISPQQHSCITRTAICLLCSSACSRGKLLLWRPHALHPHRAAGRPPAQGQTRPGWNRRRGGQKKTAPPHAPPSNLRAAGVPRGTAHRAARQPASSSRPGASPSEQRDNHRPLQRDLAVQRGAAHRTSSPTNSRAIHIQILEPTATDERKGLPGKGSNSAEMGLDEAYCSKHFVTLR